MAVLQKSGTAIFCTTHFIFHKIYVDKMKRVILKSEKHHSLYYIKENCVTDDSQHVFCFEEVK